jgi:VWFA-related protein
MRSEKPQGKNEKVKGKSKKLKVRRKPLYNKSWLRLPFAFLLLPLAFCPVPSVCAQTADAVETMKVDTNLVDLNVSVFSRVAKEGAGDLQQKDFAVYEDGEPQEIKFFASAAAPFDLVLLLDLSGSTANKMDLIRKSAQRFVDAARPTDRIGIVTFTATTEVVSPLTSDRAELKKRIKEMKKQGGGTNFWDALAFVLKRFIGPASAPSPNTRQAVVLMTDGVDNALPDVAGPGSETSFDELIEMVRRADAIMLPIYLDTEEQEVRKLHRAPASAYVISREQLAQLAAESGSIVYRASKVKDLEGVYEQVIRDLGTVYSIGYEPSKKERDGAWRTVSVQLISHPELAARTKHGYYSK